LHLHLQSLSMQLFQRRSELKDTRISDDKGLPSDLVKKIVQMAAIDALLQNRSTDLVRLARVSSGALPTVTLILYSVVVLRSRKGTQSFLSSIKLKGGSFAARVVKGVRIELAFAEAARDSTVLMLHKLLDLCSSAFIHVPAVIVDHVTFRSLRHPIEAEHRTWRSVYHREIAINWAIKTVFNGLEVPAKRKATIRPNWPLPARKVHLTMGSNVMVHKQVLRLHDLCVPGRPLSGVTHVAIDCTQPSVLNPEFFVGPVRRLLGIRGLQRVVLRIAGHTCLWDDLREALVNLRDSRLALDVVGVELPGGEMEWRILHHAAKMDWFEHVLGRQDLWMKGDVMWLGEQ